MNRKRQNGRDPQNGSRPFDLWLKGAAGHLIGKMGMQHAGTMGQIKNLHFVQIGIVEDLAGKFTVGQDFFLIRLFIAENNAAADFPVVVVRIGSAKTDIGIGCQLLSQFFRCRSIKVQAIRGGINQFNGPGVRLFAVAGGKAAEFVGAEKICNVMHDSKTPSTKNVFLLSVFLCGLYFEAVNMVTTR